MPNKRISETTSKPSLAPTDMLPLAAQGSATAYHLTGENLFNSLPLASTAAPGIVELATGVETQAAADTDRAVTPVSLKSAISPVHLGQGFCQATRLGVSPPTLSALMASFSQAFGRQAAGGDLMVVTDAFDSLFLLVFDEGRGAWTGANLTAGQFVAFQ